MTERERPGGVLDPQWEEELRRGQEADGGAGSVDAELAIVHLLRHARQPEALGDEAFDRIWSEVEAEVAPAPWWRRSWVAWGVPSVAVAAAAVALIVLVPREQGGDGAIAESTPQLGADAGSEPEGAAEHGSRSRSAQAEALEKQFAMLEPRARAQVGASVDDGRGQVRGALVSTAKEAGR